VNWLTITGVKPYDGRYPFDMFDQDLSTREWGWIKRLTGYLPGTLEDGLHGGDPELFACFATLTLRRAGRISNQQVQELYDRIADEPFGTVIRLEADSENEPEGADAGPPAGSSDANRTSSGEGSTPSSAISPSPRNGSGTPASDWSEYDQLTSGR
jgi:hypothetical protein